MIKTLNNNLLQGMTTYLIGPIDFVNDDGVGWRTYFAKICSELGINITILDPTNKPKHLGQEIGIEKTVIRDLIKNGKWNEAHKKMKKIRHYDLRMVDSSDFLIIYIDIDAFMCGSFDELFLAERQQKPIFMIIKQGKYSIPTWLVSFLKENEVFDSVDDCVDHLIKLNSGKIKMDNRWVKLN